MLPEPPLNLPTAGAAIAPLEEEEEEKEEERKERTRRRRKKKTRLSFYISVLLDMYICRCWLTLTSVVFSFFLSFFNHHNGRHVAIGARHDRPSGISTTAILVRKEGGAGGWNHAGSG